MDDKKKRFIAPDAEMVSFTSEDIIAASALGFGGTLDGFDNDGGDTYKEEA